MSKLIKNLRRAAFVTILVGSAFPVSAFAGGLGDLMSKASQMKQKFDTARPSMGVAAQQFKAQLQQSAPSPQGMSGRLDSFKSAVKAKLQQQPTQLPGGVTPVSNQQTQASGLSGLRQQLDSFKNKMKGQLPTNVSNTGGMQQNPKLANMRTLFDIPNPGDIFGKDIQDQINKAQEEAAKQQQQQQQGGGAGAPPVPAPPPPPAPAPPPPPAPAPPVVQPSGFEKAAVIVGTVLSNLPRRQAPVQQFESYPVMQPQYVPVAPVQYAPPQYSQPAPQYVEPAPQYVPAPQSEMPAMERETSLADLVLVDIRKTAEATALAGPSYTLTFANQGLATSPKFVAAAIMSNDGSVAESAPKTLVEVPGMAASETKEIVLRMPRGQSKFLVLALDLNGNVSETDKANNVAVIER